MKSIKEILMEMPQLMDVTNPESWRKDMHVAHKNHLQYGTLVHSDEHTNMTRTQEHTTPKDKWVHYASQYQVHQHNNKEHPLLHVEFKDHKMNGKNGSYVSKIIKHDKNSNIWNHIKSIYDKELANHDYLISDSQQYEGGKHVWKKLTKDYEGAGKHLYLHDENGLHKISHQHILDNEHAIWGYPDHFSNKRLVVSNDSLL